MDIKHLVAVGLAACALNSPLFMQGACAEEPKPVTLSEGASIGADYSGAKVTPEFQIKAAQGVIERTVPGISKNFILEIIPQENEPDLFELEQAGDKIVLRGSDGVAICSAFNKYLMDFCKCDVSWCGDQLNVPSPLPKVTEKIRARTKLKYRTYFNYCTLSYTAPWWDWERWQKEIDFMALKGINMPLAVTGLEGVWYNTLLKYEFSDIEAREFLAGPAFMAWQWMANIQGHGGPLPKSWIESHIELGQKIVERERSLGMTPVQQGFSGYVPVAFQDKFKDNKILQKHGWCGFEPTAELDPTDPLFKQFGKSFIEEEIRLFGTSHIYAADPFHESRPPSDKPEYLREVGKNVYEVMQSADPKAKWAMQSWSIRKDIACAAPKGKLIIFDLNGKRYKNNDNFWGYEFTYGMLHNFGNRINMHGDLPQVAKNLPLRRNKRLPKCVGMGLYMEGIGQNPVFYNMWLDMIWRDEGVDPNEWLHDYAERRYGAKSAAANKAWDILLKTAYKRGTSGVESSSIIAARPALDVRKSGPNAGFGIPYNPLDLVRAFELLLEDSDRLKDSDGYRFDVADVCRQVLTNLGQELHDNLRIAYYERDRKKLEAATQAFQQLLRDVDTILKTRPEFSFDKWVADARSWGTNQAEEDLFELNASMLVTHWGPAHNPVIFDYSWREWSGLISQYYLPRWTMLHDHLLATLDSGVEYNDSKLTESHGRQALRSNDFYKKMTDWEINWIESRKKVSPAPAGDTIALAKEILSRYRPVIKRSYSAGRKKLVAEYMDKIKDKTMGAVVGVTDKPEMNGKMAKYRFSLNEAITGGGKYSFRFIQEKNGIEVKKIQILQDGSPVWDKKIRLKLRKPGFNRDVEWNLEAIAFGADYQLVVEGIVNSKRMPKTEIRLKKVD